MLRLRAWVAADVTRVWYLLASVLFVVLVTFGISRSSLGISLLRFEPSDRAGLLHGEPLAIRSDEWMRNTPLRLGVMYTGGHEHLTPLSEAPGLLTGLQGGPAATFVFFDATISRLGPYLPDAQLFAFLWWLPFYAIAIGIAYILRFLGVRPGIAVATALLACVSPAMTWWSLVAPVNLALAVGSAAAMLLAYRAAVGRGSRWRWARVAGPALLSGILLARMPLAYPPWSIPLGMLVIAPTAAALVWRKPRRTGLLVVGAVSAVALVLVGDVLIQNRHLYEALSDTVYPGLRRAAGGGVSIAYVFGADFASAYLADGLPVSGLNQSEMSTGPTLLPFAALALALVSRSRLAGDARVFAFAGVAGLVLLSAWVLLPWPSWSESIPLFSLLPPKRVAQVMGLGGLLVFAVLLEHAAASARRAKWVEWMVVAAIALGVAYTGVLLKRSYLPELSRTTILLIAGVVSISIYVARHERFYPAGLSALVAIPLIASFFSAPVMAGLGDLRGREFDSVRAMLHTAIGDGYLAADDMYTNALAMSAGLRAMSGEQVGPSQRWLTLDPEARYIAAWNRGAIVVFEWAEASSSVVIDSPRADVLVIRASPCDERVRAVGVTVVTSLRPLEAPCLRPVGDFVWGPWSRSVYQIVG